MKRRIPSVIISAFAAISAVSPAAAQTPRAFDVISIKPDRDGRGLDAGTQPGGRYTARNVSAQFLMMQAFGVKAYQILDAPKWLSDEHYDIAAKLDNPNQLSQEQLDPLLQSMLVDRFKLKFHTEQREFPAYSLVLGKGGAKFPADNNILIPSSLRVSSNNGRASMTGKKMSMTDLAKHLGDMAGRTVLDNTGLKGNFDFKLDWATSEAANDALPSIFTAVQEQLGLKFNPVKKAPVLVVVIESIEKASGN
jgi:uncharacterized protein (TIGR03435 family)